MEVQVKELLESIQKDGIEAAEQKSKELLSHAQSEAEGIIAKAKKEAASLLEQAETQIRRKEASSKASLEQASRDVVLSLEQKIKSVLHAALLGEVGKAMTGKDLAALIELVVKSEIAPSSELQVEFSKNEAQKLLAALNKSLAGELEAGLEIAPVPQMTRGFVVRQKDGKAYYDFTAAEITEILARFVNPYVASLMQEAEQKGE